MHGLPTIPVVRLGAGVTVSAEEGLADAVQGGEYVGGVYCVCKLSVFPSLLSRSPPQHVACVVYFTH